LSGMSAGLTDVGTPLSGGRAASSVAATWVRSERARKETGAARCAFEPAQSL
jgi:hypothetical protein